MSIAIVPILMGEGITADVDAVKRAKESLNTKRLMRPCQAYPGSPQPWLCVGVTPNYPADFAYVGSFQSPRLADAIGALLDENNYHIYRASEVLEKWLGAEPGSVREWSAREVEEWEAKMQEDHWTTEDLLDIAKENAVADAKASGRYKNVAKWNS